MEVLFYGEEHGSAFENTHKFYAVIFFDAESRYKGIYGRLPGYGNRTKTIKEVTLTGQWDANNKIRAKQKNYKKTQIPDWLSAALGDSTDSNDMWKKLERMFEEAL